MLAQCTKRKLQFQELPRRRLEVTFEGGRITTNGGAPLLREVDARASLMRRFAECFGDARDPSRIEHTLVELLRQRVYALALGYEDVNDHDELRHDALLSALVGKADPTGASRRQRADQGCALAARSTLSRLEQAPERPDRYHRITCDGPAIERFFVETFLQAHEEAPERIVLDLDATDDPLHGRQEGRFFHGYYRCYCYLPLYIFCGDFLLAATLRRANIDASAGTVEHLERIIPRIRAAWPQTKILLRADSAFARDRIMTWCEQREIDYVFGLARNNRLEIMIEPWMERVRRKALRRRRPARRYKNLRYRTRESWSRSRRVVAKIEHLVGKANPRFVVTSLPREEMGAWLIYETLYCPRGEMENRIKEQQLDLFADRTSTRRMRSNQLRLYFSSLAYTLIMLLRRWGLAGLEEARLQCGTIRQKLLKIGARVQVSTRRVVAHLAEGYPYKRLLCQVHANLQRAGPLAWVR